jgi:uncharacterized repeat protein (TIGR01451 family)
MESSMRHVSPLVLLSVIAGCLLASPVLAQSADLQVTKTDATDPLAAGTVQTYTITVTNAGPDASEFVSLEDTLPAGTTFVSLSEPPGWTCSTPAVGSGGTVSCSIDSMPVGFEIFTLAVLFDAGLTPGTVVTNTADVSAETADENPGNESASAATTVGQPGADLTIAKSGSPDPVVRGTDLTFTITVVNNGPGDAVTVQLFDSLPIETTFQSISSPGGWTCSTPAVGANGDVSCSIASLAPGSYVFTLVVNVNASTTVGSFISNTAVVSSPTEDPNPENESASSLTEVTHPPAATLSATKTVSGQFRPGGAIVYTVVLTNSGPGPQGDNPGDELTDVLPPELHLVSASATSGTAVATPATNTVTWNGALASGASVTITIQATIDAGVANGTTITNQAAIAWDGDADGTNESTGVSDDPGIPGSGDPTPLLVTLSVVEIPTLDVLGVALLTALLALAAARRLRERRL